MTDDMDIVSNEVRPLPVLLYGRSWCEDTAATRQRLIELDIPFVEVDIEKDEQAAQYVEFVNHGVIHTPTLVFGDQEFIIVEPTRDELLQALRRAGYGF